MIRLIGLGGAGKSTIGALLAERLGVPFVDLDRHFADRVGEISEYIGRHGYEAYARENVEAYCSKQFVIPALTDIDERQLREVGVLLLEQSPNQGWINRDFGLFGSVVLWVALVRTER